MNIRPPFEPTLDEDSGFVLGANEDSLWAVPAPGTARDILSFPALLSPRERFLLWALVFAQSPSRVLEIGSYRLGSARIILRALRDLGGDRGLACVEPHPESSGITKHEMSLIKVIVGESPKALPKARAALGGRPDFVFLDGDHRKAAVLDDLIALSRICSPQGVILCHDWDNLETKAAIRTAVEQTEYAIGACWSIPTRGTDAMGIPQVWGGLALLHGPEMFA